MCTTKCAFFCFGGFLHLWAFACILLEFNLYKCKCVCVYPHMRVSDARPSSHPSVICRGFVALTRTCTKETGFVVV